MNDKAKERSERQKKPYLKPEVKKVDLTPEEAVLGFCKNSTVYGPMNVGYTNCSHVTCYGQGS